jgi:hypothetical protein
MGLGLSPAVSLRRWLRKDKPSININVEFGMRSAEFLLVIPHSPLRTQGDVMAKKVLRTKLCDMLGIEYPIICAGMGPTLIGETTGAPVEMVEETVDILTRRLSENVVAK